MIKRISRRSMFDDDDVKHAIDVEINQLVLQYLMYTAIYLHRKMS